MPWRCPVSGRNIGRVATRSGEPAYINAKPRLRQSAVDRKRSYEQAEVRPRGSLLSRLFDGAQ